LANGTFDGGISMPWSASFTAPAEGDTSVVGGALCLDVRNKGKNRWDAQLRHRQMVIQKGHRYRVQFRAWSDQPTRARPKLGMAGPPYAEYWADTIELGPDPKRFSAELVMQHADDPTAELAFHAGAELALAKEPYRICIDDVLLEDPSFVRSATAESAAVPKILVNQLGYLPQLAKLATLRSDAATPLGWQLLDGAGSAVASGQTTPRGEDPDSGDRVHAIDFSSFQGTGDGFRLRVGNDQSHPFSIRADLYAHLRYDALAFFYHQRSGVEIRMPFAREPRFTRPRAHASDHSVPCGPEAGCSYTLDVAGGWYDAGDHGKYVVNGGITVWTLLNLYERAALSGVGLAALGDRSMTIPEAGNHVPDLLDEARFELDFLMKMQVPEGQPLAGMVHHKVHDVHWTELGTAPHEDRMQRVLYPPSTAATLNVAAVAAQASRIYKTIDAGYSQRCLVAATRAWRAAVAHPNVIASNHVEGGGAYDDKDVRDELYWAAAELFVTTKDAAYLPTLKSSPFWLRVGTTLPGTAADAGQHTTLTWQNVDAAGNISLALSPTALPEEERARVRASLLHAADNLLEVRARQGYHLPFASGPDKSYPWGSNSFVLDNALALALAYDFTQDTKYRDGVVSAMDYVLGENPLDQSYVTGYGARPLRHPHHRFFASQAVPGRPDPPPGFVSGGPNTGVQDPIARAAGLKGLPPEKCFIDNIESYSTNEVAINWNAPLAWIVAFLDEQAR
jgi:endoglucanase